MTKVVGMNGGDKALQIIKIAGYGLGMNSKQFIRAAVDSYINNKYGIDISEIDSESIKLKELHYDEAKQIIEGMI